MNKEIKADSGTSSPTFGNNHVVRCFCRNMKRLNITDGVLDKLGFSEYWDEHGTWGGRTLTFSNDTIFRIIEQEEMEDDSEGYSKDGVYVAQYFYFADWFAIPKIDKGHFDLFFLRLRLYAVANKTAKTLN